MSPEKLFDLIPAPIDIHRRIVEASRDLHLLRRLLRLSLAARRTREPDRTEATQPVQGVPRA